MSSVDSRHQFILDQIEVRGSVNVAGLADILDVSEMTIRRDFRELEIDLESLSQSFIDFFELSHTCKYRGCTHINEPNCAVKAKLTENEVYDQRYSNYKNFVEEIKSQKVFYPKK